MPKKSEQDFILTPEAIARLTDIIIQKQDFHPDNHQGETAQILIDIFQNVITFLQGSDLLQVPSIIIFAEYCISTQSQETIELFSCLLTHRAAEIPIESVTELIEEYESFFKANEAIWLLILEKINISFIDKNAEYGISKAFWLTHPIAEQKIQAFLDFANQKNAPTELRGAIGERQNVLNRFLQKQRSHLRDQDSWLLFDNLLCAKNDNIPILFLDYFVKNKILPCKEALYPEFIKTIWRRANYILHIKVIVYLKNLHPNIPLDHVFGGETLLFRSLTNPSVLIMTEQFEGERQKTQEERNRNLAFLLSLGASFAPIEYLTEKSEDAGYTWNGYVLDHAKKEQQKEEMQTFYNHFAGIRPLVMAELKDLLQPALVGVIINYISCDCVCPRLPPIQIVNCCNSIITWQSPRWPVLEHNPPTSSNTQTEIQLNQESALSPIGDAHKTCLKT